MAGKSTEKLALAHAMASGKARIAQVINKVALDPLSRIFFKHCKKLHGIILIAIR